MTHGATEIKEEMKRITKDRKEKTKAGEGRGQDEGRKHARSVVVKCRALQNFNQAPSS